MVGSHHAALPYTHPRLVVLEGVTGAGKTEVLEALAAQGCQVLHLEEVAAHRGSVFGKMSCPQPSAEMFGRLVARTWRTFEPAEAVYIEDKGSYLGRLALPVALVERMAEAPRVRIEAELAQRSARLREAYRDLQPAQLTRALRTLRSRLKPAEAARARSALRSGDLECFVEALLAYYDRAYAHGARGARPLGIVHWQSRTAEEMAHTILAMVALRPDDSGAEADAPRDCQHCR